MKEKIICHIVSGFLGAGKSRFIEQLLSYKPENEKWAVLINESGRHQYAITRAAANNVYIKEVHGGCLCCTAGIPFRVALNKLIKEAAPQRIFIEPAGAGHLANIINLLQGQFYLPVLSLTPTICLLSEAQLAESQYTQNEGYVSLIEQADRLCVDGEKGHMLADKMAKLYAQPLYILKNNPQDLAFITD